MKTHNRVIFIFSMRRLLAYKSARSVGNFELKNCNLERIFNKFRLENKNFVLEKYLTKFVAFFIRLPKFPLPIDQKWKYSCFDMMKMTKISTLYSRK